jgi:ATP-binding cassette subfamily B protein
MRLAGPHRWLLVWASVAGVVSLGCGLALPLVTEHVIDDAILARHHRLIVPLAAAALGIAALRAAMNFLRRNLSGEASIRVEADLRGRLFGHLQGLPISFHDHWQSGQLLARATSDLTSIRDFLGYAVAFFGFLSITALGVLVAVALKSVVIAALLLILGVPFVLTAARFNRRMEDVSAQSRQAVGEVADVVSESAGGIRILKAFGVEQRAVDRLDTAASVLRDVNITAVGYRSRYVPALNLLPNLILGAVVGVGGLQVLDGQLSLGALVAVTQYLYLLVVPLRYVGWMLSAAQQALAASRRVFEILDTEPEIRDAPTALPIGPVAGDIRFEHVSFTYPGSSRPALVDVSFTVRRGETVAMVGATGSGKSTLAALLPRFADPTAGRILVDGRDTRGVTLESLRSQIGVVFDEPILFSATIRDNIAFGRPDATDDEVEEAAVVAGAHRFVSALPAGYSTKVGEQGFSLSGGQRQRLALARALLIRPGILILDDPLSSVDVRTEAAIEANLRRLLGGRTTLLIAHRASTVAMADRVLLLEAGRVVASGTHRDLLQRDPAYRRVLAAELHIEELTT